MNEQVFGIDPQVSARFPDIGIGTAMIRGVKVARSSAALDQERDEIIENVQRKLAGGTVLDLDSVQAFRRVYREFGVDPNSWRPSAEALLRRVTGSGRGLYRVNTLVDAYNLSSVETRFPMAAYDLRRVNLPITLRFSSGGEPFRAIGSDIEEETREGELVYADSSRILCRSFNYRDAEATKITITTEDVIVFVDVCGPTDREALHEALNLVCDRIIAHNGGRLEPIGLYGAEAARMSSSSQPG